MEKITATVNNRQYSLPDKPVVVVCIDGSEPDYDSSDNGGYIERAIAAGKMPFTKWLFEYGTVTTAHSQIPSFTNPNNLSIITGSPPSVHGISGNFFYDRDADEEIMMNHTRFLRAPTIMQGLYEAGAKVAVVTAKDKLRTLLGNGLKFDEGRAICFSAERADEAGLTDNGIENVLDMVGLQLPEVYSGDLSEFVFAAGVKLVDQFKPDVMYLSTTDYIQHKFAPGSDGANKFYGMMDSYWQQLHDRGVILALTADHGMKAKHDDDGNSNAIYLSDLLDDWIGTGTHRVILPITDPYVLHHGALGGFATIYIDDANRIDEVTEKLKNTAGIDYVNDSDSACAELGLPRDRVGDIIVTCEGYTTLGTTPARHDLSQMKEPLRSHGGFTEQTVPFMVNSKLAEDLSVRYLRNFDIFDVAINSV